LELLLTEFERGGWRRAEQLIDFGRDAGSDGSLPVQTPEGKDVFFKPQRHLLAITVNRASSLKETLLELEGNNFRGDCGVS